MPDHINKEELRKTIKMLQRLLDRLPDDLEESEEFDLLEAIIAELTEAKGPVLDWQLVETIGPRVGWGSGSAEVWKSLLSNVGPRQALVAVDADRREVPFNKTRPYAMRKARTTKGKYPGNLIALREWISG